MEIGDAIYEVGKELKTALKTYPKFASPHEGWAILREEVDELWEEVKKKPTKRSVDKMRREAIQIAAMATRFVMEST